jgi:hypothetical protein
MERVEELQSDDEIPGASRAFVRPPTNERIYDGGFDLRNRGLVLPDSPLGGGGFTGPSGNSPPNEAVKEDSTFFFPLPYNEEQISVVKALEEHDGVVVQGPPGTGKTHTIANIISYYLALGGSVLVTAKTAEALNAVQQKLPEGIRNLAISVIHNDREGAQQLETAMKMLANEAKQIDIKKTVNECREKQKRIADILARLETIKDELQSIAKSNLNKVTFRGREWMPMDLAREVTALKTSHDWFPDRPNESLSDPCPISASDVARLRELRSSLGKDLLYSTVSLPDPASLPSLGEIITAHEELTLRATVDHEIESGNVPLMALTNDSDISDAQELLAFLKGIDAFFRVRSESAWFNAFASVALRHANGGSPVAERVQWFVNEWVALGQKGKDFVARRVSVGNSHPNDEELNAAIDALWHAT